MVVRVSEVGCGEAVGEAGAVARACGGAYEETAVAEAGV